MIEKCKLIEIKSPETILRYPEERHICQFSGHLETSEDTSSLCCRSDWYYNESVLPHTSLSSQTPEWLAPFCFIAHQTGLVLSARPLDQGSATSAEAGVDRGCTPRRGTHGRLEQMLRRLEQQAREGPPGGTSQQVERKRQRRGGSVSSL